MIAPLKRQSARREELGDGVRLHHPSGQVAVCAAADLDDRLVGAALALGFSRAGRTALRDFSHEASELETFVAQGRHGVMSYLAQRGADGRLTRSTAEALMPGARSAFVVALPYDPVEPLQRATTQVAEATATGLVAHYAGGRDYHAVIKERLLLLADVLADLSGSPVRARACVDTAPLFERQLARDSGWAFLGKHTLAIAPGFGSSFNLGVLLLDLPAPLVLPLASEGCGRCRSCRDVCPTGALDHDYQIDPRLCISYLTIEYRGIVPRELRAKMGRWVFGCDLCQAICPYNAARGVPPAAPEVTQGAAWRAPPLLELLTMNSSAYKRAVRGTALRRVDRGQLVRNAAIAIGNAALAEAVSPLFEVASRFPTEPARVHATWALGRLLQRGVEPARGLLERLATEDESFQEEVRKEARLSLEEALSPAPARAPSSAS